MRRRLPQSPIGEAGRQAGMLPGRQAGRETRGERREKRGERGEERGERGQERGERRGEHNITIIAPGVLISVFLVLSSAF